MPRFERVCPECGASNAYDKTQCIKCRAPLTNAPASRNSPAALISRKGMAILAWRATKFMTRWGIQLARRGAQRGIEKIRARPRVNVQDQTIDGDYEIPQPAAPENFPPAREWRVWSGAADDDTSEAKTTLHWGASPRRKTG
ncbi:MAG: hypothetical protein HY741_11420 [Chloroflexi bacterium]|nr:hypothetical protein [Chloroflexota bacterium]